MKEPTCWCLCALWRDLVTVGSVWEMESCWYGCRCTNTAGCSHGAELLLVMMRTGVPDGSV